MNLKYYIVEPDPGLFDRIERRLRRRRLLRRGAVAASACAVAAVAVWLCVDAAGSGPQAAVPDQSARAVIRREVAEPAASEKPTAVVQPVAVKGERVATTPVPSAPAPVEKPIAEPPTVAPAAVAEAAPVDVPAPSVAAAPATNPSAPVVVDSPAPSPDAPSATADAAPLATKAGSPADTMPHVDNLVWAPNIIVPSGDVEANRFFGLRFSSPVSDFHIYIYNRGGRQVFTSNNPDFAWDGASLPQGAYVWVAKFRDSNNKMHHEKGTVTIVR